jgi:hypothetical protein
MEDFKSRQYLRAMTLAATLLGLVLAAHPAQAAVGPREELVKAYANKPIGRMSFKSSNVLKATSSTIPAKITGDTNVGITPTDRSILRVNFCGEFRSPDGGGVIVIAVIDPGTLDEVIHPGTIVLDQALPTTLTTRCFEWAHFFVNPGQHFVEIQWASLVDGQTVEIRRRTMTVMSQ